MHFIVQGNIIFINFQLFRVNELTPILDRIKHIYINSNFTFSFCGFYQSDCNGYFVLHLRDCKQKINTINDLYNMPCSITSVAKILIFPDIIEIYDVCTITQQRNKGYMTELLHELIQTFANKKLWLGIKFTHPYYSKIVDLYIKMGFGNPVLTKQTTQGNLLAHPVLSLSYPTSQKYQQIKYESNLIKIQNNMNTSAGVYNYFTNY